MHEVATYIEFQHVAFPRPVLRLLADMLREAQNAVERPASLDAGERVAYERRLVEFVRVVEVEVMHYPVRETGQHKSPAS